jgi:SAM-dependent methyltransferase
MNYEKIVPIVKGMIKHIPGVKSLIHMNTGGTNESRYCYSVWHRHLNNWRAANSQLPQTAAELGPGDSLGIGFSALLSGVDQVHFLDVVKYWDSKRNLTIFEELVELFRSKAAIPNNGEYPLVTPALEDYSFPSNILTDEILKKSLDENRLNSIRKEILNIDNPGNSFIKYQIPWFSSDIVQPDTLDFIYSQAVLEHVEDLDNTYMAMRRWLKPAGLMSHSIDFRSHGITPSWNGHWTFSDFEWQIVKGGKSFLINRQPYSKHLELHSKHGFDLIFDKPEKSANKYKRDQIAKTFRALSENDLTTSTTYILSRKK